MSLVEDDNRVVEFQVEAVADLLVDQVVVRHEDDIGHVGSFFVAVIGAELESFGQFVEFFNVGDVPLHVSGLLPILVVDAGVDCLLRIFTGSVEGIASVHVHHFIDTEVISRSNYN